LIYPCYHEDVATVLLTAAIVGPVVAA